MTADIVIRALGSITSRVRNLAPKHAEDQINAAVIVAATSYCGAHPDHTSTTVWKECVGHVIRFYPDIMVEEIMEAFRLASTGKWSDLDLNAYRGQFTVNLFASVMKEYAQDRASIRIAVDGALAEMTEEHLKEVEAEKNRAAADGFFAEFQDLKARGIVPELAWIRFFWFNALRDRGALDSVDRSQKEQLWKESFSILMQEKQDFSGSNRIQTMSTVNLLTKMYQNGTTPEEWKGLRETIYKKLIIRQALMNAAMDTLPWKKLSQSVPEEKTEDLPF